MKKRRRLRSKIIIIQSVVCELFYDKKLRVKNVNQKEEQNVKEKRKEIFFFFYKKKNVKKKMLKRNLKILNEAKNVQHEKE